MTTELEKQFFDTFEIEPKYQDTCTVEEKYWANEELANEYGTFDRYMDIKCGNQENCTTECSCAYQKEIYPQITDRHYLELIVLLSGVCCMNFAFERSLDEMKYKILKITMEYKKILKHQVQAIFEGEI